MTHRMAAAHPGARGIRDRSAHQHGVAADRRYRVLSAAAILPALSRDSQESYAAGLIVCLGIPVLQVVIMHRFGRAPSQKLWRIVTSGSVRGSAELTNSRG